MAQGEGGAMYIVTDSDINIESTVFENNYSYVEGGAIFNNNSNPTLKDVDFFFNTSASGGALYSWISDNVNIQNAQFVGNETTYSGGAVTFSSGEGGWIRDSLFLSNYADSKWWRRSK